MTRTQPTCGELNRRYLASGLGIVIMMMGTAIVTLSQLGTAPVSSPIWAVTLIGGFSFGGWTFVINILFIVAQFFLLRPAFPKSGWLQFPAAALASLTLDFWMWIFGALRTESYIGSVGIVLLGSVILAFGVSLLAAARSLYMPGEGLVAAISQRFDFAFPKVKLGFDLSCVIAAVLLSLIFVGSMEAVREATLISAFIIGPLVGWFLPFSRKIVGNVTN